MFCDQCEQTARGVGCTDVGVCGKDAQTALEQDQLVYMLRHLSFLADVAARKKLDVRSQDDFITKALFATLTNVNFDSVVLHDMQMKAFARCKDLSARVGEAPAPLNENFDDYLGQLTEKMVGIKGWSDDEDIDSAMQLLLYGLKGLCACKLNAQRLGKEDPDLSAYVRKALVTGTRWDGESRDLGGWLELVLECGRQNIKAMELLDCANSARFGDPETVFLNTGHSKGKCILVSGHDYLDLEMLLAQTVGLGINVYTHCEMLPAHAYPKFKSFPHLVGNFGSSWANQRVELAAFPGPILFTTNCIQNPGDYAHKVFTSGEVGWRGCRHLSGGDFSELISKAREMPGFSSDAPGIVSVTGFGPKAMRNFPPVMADAISHGQLKHIFVVGGCDGERCSRKYYTEFARETPSDTIVFAMGCGKFRFNMEKMGKLGELPRFIDCGQCNDVYKAIRIAQSLAKAKKRAINDLPFSVVLSWYEQRSIAILLAMLYLGIKNIIIGPTLPAFLSPGIVKILSEQWGVRLMGSASQDLASILS